MRNILLVIEDSPNSVQLIRAALNVARQCVANLILCKMIKIPSNLQLVIAGNDSDLPDEYEGLDVFEYVSSLAAKTETTGNFRPEVTCLELENFDPQKIRELVMVHAIWLCILRKPPVGELRLKDRGDAGWQAINKLNCPVLLIPGSTDCRSVNNVAYATDLRYCDKGIIRFLKTFSVPVYVTHITAPGLVDMEERYAQQLLGNEISSCVNYRKLFLRNIKGNQVCQSLDHELDHIDIKIISIYNHNQSLLERLLGEPSGRVYNYQHLPFLIFPYLNWFMLPSFYE